MKYWSQMSLGSILDAIMDQMRARRPADDQASRRRRYLSHKELLIEGLGGWVSGCGALLVGRFVCASKQRRLPWRVQPLAGSWSWLKLNGSDGY